jgi:hypothetical protein
MSDNDRLRQALEAPFPDHAIKNRKGGGGSSFDYVEGFTIIRRLNEATGGTWDWAIRSFEFRPLPPTKMGKDQSLVVVTGELTIPGLGTRAGVGVQKVSEDGGEDLVKGASTDALKKAATLFGVALDLYGPDYEGDLRPPPPLLTEEQDKVLAQARDMGEARDTYGATKALVLTLKQAATEDQWKEINREWAAIRKTYYPETTQAERPASYSG